MTTHHVRECDNSDDRHRNTKGITKDNSMVEEPGPETPQAASDYFNGETGSHALELRAGKLPDASRVAFHAGDVEPAVHHRRRQQEDVIVRAESQTQILLRATAGLRSGRHVKLVVRLSVAFRGA
eukprot:CAMPEP_0198129582 /NCGR_PEP_ID=MMETSP1442-20131203/52058_1 /TAXON_ID= /ORGANISM="Craspedostauros australis, Strain CCMP3328" /LENGTH=124 /DNA_ID=CAMNT_0043790005 /DNA_START=1246 /DNA_END=1616 /DNA_ORIENTATION=+